MIEAKLIDHMGSDLSVVNAARVSFGKASDWENKDDLMLDPSLEPILKEGDTKLIRYLASHEHMSPFGHCFASFHVKAPIFVARQLVKHKFLRWNEVSRRYVDDEPEFYTPEVWRGRSEDKKQGSDGVVSLDKALQVNLAFAESDALTNYEWLIESGVAPEQARLILPVSQYTEWYWSGSLDAFSDMCNLRCKPDTQYESQLVANQIDTIMGDLYPVSWKELSQ